MLINVSELLKAKKGTVLKTNFVISPRRIDEEASLRGPLKGTVQLIKQDEGILADYKFSSNLQLLCYRCASHFNHFLKSHFQQRYIYNEKMSHCAFGEEQEKGFLIGKDKKIDPWPAIRQIIILSLPVKILCQKKCRGICPHCGRNLNKEKCQCQNKNLHKN